MCGVVSSNFASRHKDRHSDGFSRGKLAKCANVFRSMKKREKMENPDDAIVIAEDTSKIDRILDDHCATCTTNEKKVNWQNHAKDPEHIMTLRRFEAIFDVQGEKLRCTVCDATLKWKELKMHAAVHKILPWHESNDRYQNFFKNHIFQWESNFYCYPCDNIFTDWCSAFEHLSWSAHRERMEMELHGNLTLLLPSGEVSYKCCINNGVFAWGTEVGCKICNLTNIGQQNIGRHICGPEHKTLKSAITTNLMNRITTANASKCSSTTYAEKNLVTRSNGENASRDYPGKNTNERVDKLVSIEENARCCDDREGAAIEVPPVECEPTCVDIRVAIDSPKKPKPVFESYYGHSSGNDYEKKHNDYSQCRICNCVIANNAYDAHVAEKRHAEYLRQFDDNKISWNENKHYYCDYCKCTVGSFRHITEHVKGQKHRTLLNESEKQAVSTSGAILIETASTKQSSHLCNSACKNTTCVNFEKLKNGDNKFVVHIAGNQHINGHINGKRHTLSKGDNIPINFALANNEIPVKFEPKVSATPASIPAKVEAMEEAMPASKGVCYIVKLRDVSFLCKICNIHLIGKKTLEAHLTEDRHAKSFEKYGCDKISLREGTTYYCSCCACKISGLDNVYLHIKGFRHTNSLNISTETRKPLSWDPIASSLTNGLKKSATKSVPVASKCEMNSSKKLLSSTRLFGDLEENSRGEKICCPICGDMLSSAVKLHAHLARHFSATFSRSREIRKTNEKKIVNSSSEAIFDNNGKLVNTGLAMDGKKTFAKRQTIISVKNVLRQLDFKSDFIYEMRDKIIDIELSMKLFFTIDANTVYCFVCQKIIESTQSLFDHLQSLDHCTYLDKIENCHRLFADFPDQFSELDLALEYMEEITDDMVRCRACEGRLHNNDRILREHIDGNKHKKKCEKTRNKAKENFELVKPKVRCDWYRVQRYWCVPCFKIYRSEVNFVKHLGSDDHAFVMETRDSRKRKMILEFCEPCALLWYGYRCTYAYHCDISTHLWLVRDGHYACNELPEAVNNLLISLEDYVENKIKYYSEVSTRERDKEKTLFRDIEDAVKSKFPKCKAYAFGSRVSGLGSPDSDIDVFLDCGNMYDGKASSMEQISKFMIDVHECLSKEPKSWDVDERLTSCRSPIIKARHRVTGLSCDISFENGLAVENTKLIKSFNDFYPSCRKMILFLKQWLTLSGLTGSQGITSYALCWCVIFFLQNESILPSVARLIAKKDESHTIAGWQVGVDRNFTYSNTENNFSLKNLLVRFFTFYANFEFRYEVACPVLGKAVKKRVFADPKKLPEEMAAYIAYVENTDSPVPFRIDSPMCIQDPFDLQHNLTKAVSKVYLSRFRNYCSNSLDILCSSGM